MNNVEEADYLVRSAPIAIGSENFSIDFSLGSWTNFYLYYLSAEDIDAFKRSRS